MQLSRVLRPPLTGYSHFKCQNAQRIGELTGEHLVLAQLIDTERAIAENAIPPAAVDLVRNPPTVAAHPMTRESTTEEETEANRGTVHARDRAARIATTGSIATITEGTSTTGATTGHAHVQRPL